MKNKFPYELLTNDLLYSISENAKISNRKRKNYNFHNLQDNVQRMLNAIEPNSYVQPHRHVSPPKVEFFMRIKGRAAILIFDDNGKVVDIIILDDNTQGIDIKPGIWHTLISLEEGTVVFETKDGPYVEECDKEIAPWAPPEYSIESAAYLESLHESIKTYIEQKSQ